MLYSKSFIELVKTRYTLSELIGQYIPVKRAGREYQALCPFHKEKTPSFTINNEKGFYHCFGCGAHGDAVGFVKDYEGINYKDAIEKLANDAGIALPKVSAEQVQKEKQRKELHEVMEIACSWYETQLASADGYAASNYLDGRGISRESIQKFRIGFAPDQSDNFIRYMLKQDITPQQMLDTGLVIQIDGRKPYARFRGRVMFPIRDRAGKVVAFGGRVLPELANPNAPKYLNSPETELFHKGYMLFNEDLARRPAMDRGNVLLCEGYMDVIALDQVGIHHAVAPLGTAVTAEQLKQLWTMAPEPVVCLDGDNAGKRAMLRAAELALPMLAPGKSLRFCALPSGHDPDSYVSAYGVDSFLSLTYSATGLADTLWQHIAGNRAKTPEEKAGQESELLKLAAMVEHPSVKAHYRAYFKDKLWETSRKVQHKGMRRTKTSGVSKDISLPNPVTVPPLPKESADQRRQDSAMHMVRLVLLYPAMLSDPAVEECVAQLAFSDQASDRLKQKLMSAICMQPDIDRQALKDVLCSGQSDATYDAIVSDSRTTLPQKMKDDRDNLYLHDAQRMWKQAYNAYYTAGLMDEFKRAEVEMANDMNQETMSRLLELKGELEKVEYERQKIYMETLEDAG